MTYKNVSQFIRQLSDKKKILQPQWSFHLPQNFFYMEKLTRTFSRNALDVTYCCTYLRHEFITLWSIQWLFVNLWFVSILIVASMIGVRCMIGVRWKSFLFGWHSRWCSGDTVFYHLFVMRCAIWYHFYNLRRWKRPMEEWYF